MSELQPASRDGWVFDLAERAEDDDAIFTAVEVRRLLDRVHVSDVPDFDPYRGQRPRTDWVIVGESRPSGPDVMVIASKELSSRARIERSLTNVGEVWHGRRLTGRKPIYDARVQTELHDVIEVIAPTYAEAMSELMRRWSPEGEPLRPEIEGRRELES